MLLGIIEGGTSNFNDDCKGGLQNMVRSSFSVLSTYQIWLPQNTAKFNLANVGLTEASNIVYAHCSVTPVFDQIASLVDFNDPDSFIIVFARISGGMINTIPELRTCVKEGQEKRDGYMVGLCSANMAVTLLDASL